MVNKIFKWLVILPILAILVILPIAPASAADLRSGDAVIVASGDVIDDDLYAAAGKIVINGTVNGDVLCIGETITIDGTINGSVTALGATVVIDGEITHAVRVAGGNIDIRGNIGKDIMVAGDDVDVESTAAIGRDLAFVVRKIRVDALIEDSIKGVGKTADLNSGVGGDVEIEIEKLTIEPTANIQGNLIYVSKNEATILQGARIGGTTTHNMPASREPTVPRSVNVWVRVIFFLMTLVAGGLIILIAPKRAEAVAASIKRKPWLSLGWGALIFFATPIAAIITFITVIGIPVGIIGLIIYGIAIYLSQIAVGLFIGYWIIGYFNKVESRGILLGAFALGLAILTLVQLIPYIGPVLCFGTILFGFGAMALSQKTLRTMTPVQKPEITIT
jgi:hypothetical protein